MMEKIEMPVFTEQKVLQYMHLCNVLHVFGVMNKSAIFYFNRQYQHRTVSIVTTFVY